MGASRIGVETSDVGESGVSIGTRVGSAVMNWGVEYGGTKSWMDVAVCMDGQAPFCVLLL